jgi:hypothetical protein
LRVAAITYELAAQDRLILVGAGGQFLLAGLPGVLRAKVIAPADIRAARLASAYDLQLVAAQRAVARGDREQVEYNRAVFDADWLDALHWDLTINSDGLAPDVVCAVILAALNASGGVMALPPPVARATATAAAINRAFAERAFAGAWPFAMPSADGALLQGDALTAEDHTEVVMAANQVAGGDRVIDRIVVAGRKSSE